MLKALKVIMIVYGALLVVVGAMQVFFPDLLADLMEMGAVPDVCAPVLYGLATAGALHIAAGVFVIIAGTRDILHHIAWVQFTLLVAILGVAVAVYSVLMGYVTFNQTMIPLIIDGLFFILLMVFYPWGRTAD